MRYQELLVNGKSIKNQREIDVILKSQKFYWLVDSEIENAKIEIKKDTLIWHSGDFYTGNWKYGIFKKGKFYGNWKNGIFGFNPTKNHDVRNGFVVGSRWVHENGDIYVCTDNKISDAVWEIEV